MLNVFYITRNEFNMSLVKLRTCDLAFLKSPLPFTGIGRLLNAFAQVIVLVICIIHFILSVHGRIDIIQSNTRIRGQY